MERFGMSRPTLPEGFQVLGPSPAAPTKPPALCQRRRIKAEEFLPAGYESSTGVELLERTASTNGKSSPTSRHPTACGRGSASDATEINVDASSRPSIAVQYPVPL